MPKPPAMASDTEVNEFLKGSATAGPTPSTMPPGTTSSDSNKGITSNGVSNDIQIGMARTAARGAVGAARLVGKGIGLISPSLQTELGQYAELEPGVKSLEQFSDQPDKNNWQKAGGLGLGLMSGLALEKGVASGVANVVDRLTPLAKATRTQGLGPYAGSKLRMVPTTAGKVTKYVAPTTGALTAGAAGGVAGDPQDPVRGAEIGAASAGVFPAASAFLRGPIGQGLANIFGRHAPAELTGAVAHAFGIPWHMLWGLGLIPALRHSRAGAAAVKYAFDKSGRLLGYIDPVTGGLVAGGAARMGHTGLPYPGSHAQAPADANPFTEEDYAPANSPTSAR